MIHLWNPPWPRAATAAPNTAMATTRTMINDFVRMACQDYKGEAERDLNTLFMLDSAGHGL